MKKKVFDMFCHGFSVERDQRPGVGLSQALRCAFKHCRANTAKTFLIGSLIGNDVGECLFQAKKTSMWAEALTEASVTKAKTPKKYPFFWDGQECRGL